MSKLFWIIATVFLVFSCSADKNDWTSTLADEFGGEWSYVLIDGCVYFKVVNSDRLWGNRNVPDSIISHFSKVEEIMPDSLIARLGCSEFKLIEKWNFGIAKKEKSMVYAFGE